MESVASGGTRMESWGRRGHPSSHLNPFQTTQGNRHSCRHQEGRRGSDEVVSGPSVFPSREPGVSGNFWGSHERCQVLFRTSGRKLGLPLRRHSGQEAHLAKTLEPRGFPRVAAGFWSYDVDLRLPLGLALGSPIFPSSEWRWFLEWHGLKDRS